MSSLHLYRLHAAGLLPDYAKSMMQHFPTTYTNPLTGKTVTSSSSSGSGSQRAAAAKTTVLMRSPGGAIPRGAAFTVDSKDPQRLQRLRADIRAKFADVHAALRKNDIALLGRNDEAIQTNAQLDRAVARQPHGLYYVETPTMAPIPELAPLVESVRAALAPVAAAAQPTDYKAAICDAIAASVAVPAASRVELRRAIGAVLQKHAPLLKLAGVKNAPREASLIAADLTHELLLKCSQHAVPQEPERKRAFVRKFTGEAGAWSSIGAPIQCGKRANINASAHMQYATYTVAPQPDTVVTTISDMLRAAEDPIHKLGYRPIAATPCKQCAIGAPCCQHAAAASASNLLSVAASMYNSDNDAEYEPFTETLSSVGKHMCADCPLHPDGKHPKCSLCAAHRKHVDSELKGIGCPTCGKHKSAKHMGSALQKVGCRTCGKHNCTEHVDAALIGAGGDAVADKHKHDKHHHGHHHGHHMFMTHEKHDAAADVYHVDSELKKVGAGGDAVAVATTSSKHAHDHHHAAEVCPLCEPGKPCLYHHDKKDAHHHHHSHLFMTHEKHDAAADVYHVDASVDKVGKHCEGGKCHFCKPGAPCPLHKQKKHIHDAITDTEKVGTCVFCTATQKCDLHTSLAHVGHRRIDEYGNYVYYDDDDYYYGHPGGVVHGAGDAATGVVSSAGAGAVGVVSSAGYAATGIVDAALSPFGQSIGNNRGGAHNHPHGVVSGTVHAAAHGAAHVTHAAAAGATHATHAAAHLISSDIGARAHEHHHHPAHSHDAVGTHSHGASHIIGAGVQKVGNDSGGGAHRTDCVDLFINNISDHDADIIIDGARAQSIPPHSHGAHLHVTPGHHRVAAMHGSEKMVAEETYNFVHCGHYSGTVSHITHRIFMDADIVAAAHHLFGGAMHHHHHHHPSAPVNNTIKIRAQLGDSAISASLLEGPGKKLRLGSAYTTVPLKAHAIEVREGDRAKVKVVDAAKLVPGASYSFVVERGQNGSLSARLKEEKLEFKPASSGAIDLS